MKVSDRTGAITDEERQVARRWSRIDEEMEFVLDIVPSLGGGEPYWIRLNCTVHGPVQAFTHMDLLSVEAVAEAHYVRKHLRRGGEQ